MNQIFKVAQSLYNAVTGKTEKLAKVFKEPFVVNLESLKQLHYKFTQMLAPWQKLAVSENVIVYHIEDDKQTFSSFDRFLMYDASNSCPIESIAYELNFLIEIPGLEKPQSYKVLVRINSQAAAAEKMEAHDPFGGGFYRFMGSASVLLEIEYVDFVIARNVLAAFDSWIKSLPTEATRGRLTRYIQVRSHLIPRFAPPLIALVSGYAVYLCTEMALATKSSNADLAKFILGTILLMTAAATIARLLADLAESSFDSIGSGGGIVINIGDQRVVAKFRKRNNNNLWKAFSASVVILLEGIAVNLISEPIVTRVFQTSALESKEPHKIPQNR